MSKARLASIELRRSQAYEDAGMQGLCAEGRWEAAVDALRTVDLAPLVREFQQPPAD